MLVFDTEASSSVNCFLDSFRVWDLPLAGNLGDQVSGDDAQMMGDQTSIDGGS